MIADLFQHSIKTILKNQSPTGAYIASPNFPVYRYSWFRDGAFISYAMNLVNEHESAHRFHNWATRVINQQANIIKRAITKAHQNKPLDSSDIIDTRYTLEGKRGSEEWGNHQLDGLGTWLWALQSHQELSREPLTNEWSKAATLVAGYLDALWQKPCYDCWEEYPDKVHTHTLAAIYAGLNAHAQLTSQNHSSTLQSIRHYLLDNGVNNGHFIKYSGSSEVDASLMGLSVPFGVFSPNDPIMHETVVKIEQTLCTDGGVHRYSKDTYYGGGEWVLLTAWLGWYYTKLGDPNSLAKAHKVRSWVQAQAGKGGNPGDLPEQVATNLNDPAWYSPWVEKWGPIASPLLWSHAMYIILDLELKG